MKNFRQPFVYFVIIAMIGIFSWNGTGYSQFSVGQSAPLFSLKDLQGITYDLSQMQEQPMIILYFFDVESRPSQEGLLTLNDLKKQYSDAQLIVWAITLSPKEKASDFVMKSNLNFPVLLDTAKVSNQYEAHIIVPTICIIGPGLKTLDYFQGGGKTTEVMLVRVAERELQRKNIQIAKALSEEVVKKNPQNVKAEIVKGYSALKEGNISGAEKVFKEVSQRGGQGEILGKEGLAATYAQKGQPEKALELAKEVEQKSPDRAYGYIIKGDILYTQGKKDQAEAAYQEAINKKEAEIYHQPIKFNQLGRLYANLGKYEKARELYDQAVAIDPYYIEATTNKGVTYEKEGEWDKALDSYRQAQSIDKNDTFAVVLAKKALEMLELQKDENRWNRINQLVKELAERYRILKDEEAKLPDKDIWTSRSMILSFVNFESGGLIERDGLSTLITSELTDSLNTSGRVKVVERVLLDLLLQELNLGSSELADKNTTLKLGKVLAAKLFGIGTLMHDTNGTLMSFRLVDTETSAIPKTITRQFAPQASLKQELYRLNREILTTIISKYPLRGYVVKVVDDHKVMINLGSNKGVVMGTKFEILEDQPPINFKGTKITPSPLTIGLIEIVEVEPDLCYARIIDQKRILKTEDKVQERMEEIAKGANDV